MSALAVWQISRAILADADGSVAVLKVFIDESGIHEGSPSISVGCYIGRPKVWRDWTVAWNRKKRPIKVFHSTDCQNFFGEFEGWDKERRDPYVAQLLPVIREHLIIGVVVGIQMDDFRAALRGRDDLIGLFGNPYGTCVHWVLATVMKMVCDRSPGERIAFFHETNEYRGEALEAFRQNKEAFARPGQIMTFTFGGKEDYPPLQAADVLAFEGGKFLRNPTGKPRRAFLALDPDRTRIRALRYGADNMPFLIETLERAALLQGQQPA